MKLYCGKANQKARLLLKKPQSNQMEKKIVQPGSATEKEDQVRDMQAFINLDSHKKMF